MKVKSERLASPSKQGLGSPLNAISQVEAVLQPREIPLMGSARLLLCYFPGSCLSALIC